MFMEAADLCEPGQAGKVFMEGHTWPGENAWATIGDITEMAIPVPVSAWQPILKPHDSSWARPEIDKYRTYNTHFKIRPVDLA